MHETMRINKIKGGEMTDYDLIRKEIKELEMRWMDTEDKSEETQLMKEIKYLESKIGDDNE